MRALLPFCFPALLALGLLLQPGAAHGQVVSQPSPATLDSLARAAYERDTAEDLERAIKLWSEAARAYARAGDKTGQAQVLRWIGIAHWDLERPDSALAYYRQSLAMAREAGDPIGEARVLGNIGWAFYSGGKADSALGNYYPALPIHREIGNRAGEATVLNNIGLVFDNLLSRPDSAVAYYRAALPLMHESGNRRGEGAVLTNLGTIFFARGRLDSALASWRTALPLQREAGDRQGEATTLNNIGATLLDLGRPDSALAYYQLALPIAREVSDRAGEGLLLTNIGLVFASLGQPDSALAYHRAALPPYRAARDRAGEGTALNNIALVFDHVGRADSALTYYRAALPLQREAGNRGGQRATLGNIGLVFFNVGRPDSALAYDRASLAIAREIRERAGEGLMLNNIGMVFLSTDRPDSALAYFRAALTNAREVGERAREATTLGGIGGVFERLNRPDSALASYQAALAIVREVGERQGEGATLNNIGRFFAVVGSPDSALAYYHAALPIVRSTGDRKVEAATLGNMGILYYESPVLRDVVRARAYFDSAATVSAGTRRQAGDEANRIAIAEQQRGLFRYWPLAWLALGSEESGIRAAHAALAAAERGRAQALLDLMQRPTPESRVASGITTPTQPGADLAAEAEAFLVPLRGTHTAALSYLLARDTVIIWFLSPAGDLRVVRAAIGSDQLGRSIFGLRAGLGADSARSAMVRATGGDEGEQDNRSGAVGTGTPGSFEASANELRSLLLPSELLAEVPPGSEIVIVPHGTLGLVPFGVLPSPGDGEPLGIRYALRYAPSLATLNAAETRAGTSSGPARTAALRHALVAGNPAMPSVTTERGARHQLRSLPGAETEARRTAALLGTDVLVGAAASETRIRQRLPTASLIHLATHGLAFGTEARVRDSYVALAPDSTSDGLLTVGEILDDPNLSLEADLVVLSACQTGLGDLKNAEGTVGLQRALLARGARSVLVSLWSVDDRATALLMERFYQHWLRDEPAISKAEALRRAQAEVRTRPEFQHPRFWAAFQLVGAR